MRNHYLEMSKGAYTVTGSATRGSRCRTPRRGTARTAARRRRRHLGSRSAAAPGRPPRATPRAPARWRSTLPIALEAAVAGTSRSPTTTSRTSSTATVTATCSSRDGFIDHVVLVHAGEDKSGGGGAQGVYAIWAHSSSVAGGADIPGTGLKLDNYIVQPEDSGVGVFSHEYGHDLGLPDLYDTSGGGRLRHRVLGPDELRLALRPDLPVDADPHGPLGQVDPGLGRPADPGAGQAARGRAAGPDVQHSGRHQGRRPRQLADKIAHACRRRTVARHRGGATTTRTGPTSGSPATSPFPAGTDVKFRFWNDYTIEADWDYGFVEVSTDGGTTWAEQKVYNTSRDAGHHARWLPGPERPDGRLRRQEVRPHRGQRTGGSTYYVDLAPFAGKNIKLRLRYATDEAFLERGWFADDFSLTNGATVLWSDNTDTNNGWTAHGGRRSPAVDGAGWKLDPGKSQAAHYYLAEWRNLDGFDKGLSYAYDSTYTPTTPGTGGAWRVEKVKYNAPGMLVWYRDTELRQRQPRHVEPVRPAEPRLQGRSAARGLALRPDAPHRRSGSRSTPTRKTPCTSRRQSANFPTRMNASDVAFTTWGTNRAEDCFVGRVAERHVLHGVRQPRRGDVVHRRQGLVPRPGVPIRVEGASSSATSTPLVVIPSTGQPVVLDADRRHRRATRSQPSTASRSRRRHFTRHRQPRRRGQADRRQFTIKSAAWATSTPRSA